MNRRVTIGVGLVLLLGLASVATAQTTWYVDCNVAGPGTGTVGDPFNTIQAGLGVCSAGDTVEVADGTCGENVLWPNTDGITLRSASDDPSACIIDASGPDGLGVGIQVVTWDPPFTPPFTLNLTIEGIGVTGAFVSGSTFPIGGIAIAVFSVSVDPPFGSVNAQMRNLLLTNNHDCPGIYGVTNNDNGLRIAVSETTFSNNGFGGLVVEGLSGNRQITVSDSTFGGNGGWGLKLAAEEVEIIGCTVTDTTAQTLITGYDGGILVGVSGATVAVKENTVSRNVGAGIWVSSVSSGSPVDPSTLEINGNTVFQNDGGILIYDISGPSITYSIVDNVIYDHTYRGDYTGLSGYGVVAGGADGSLIAENFIFNSEGTEFYSGIGIGLPGTGLGGPSGSVDVVNNMVSSNTYGVAAGSQEDGGEVRITNNTVVDSGLVGIQEFAEGSPKVTVTNCIVGDWDSGTGATDLVGVTATSSHIQDLGAADPQFVDPAGDDGILGTMDDDYHIMPTSPCRNAGSSVSAPVDDFDGDARPLEGVFDIGADEYNENTATGTNVEVFFPDRQAVVIYDLVLQAGQTTMMKTPIFGVYLGLANLLSTYVYNVETSAVFEGQAKVCLQYEVGDSELEELLEEHGLIFVMTREGEDLVYLPRGEEDLDTVNNEVCGYADHFSEFTVGYEGCTDGDEDGYGYPANPLCGHTEEDCEDADAGVNPGMAEDCGSSGQGNGIDENCNGASDETCGYSGASNAEASVYGMGAVTGSGMLNQLTLILVPIGVVIVLRRIRRKKHV